MSLFFSGLASEYNLRTLDSENNFFVSFVVLLVLIHRTASLNKGFRALQREI